MGALPAALLRIELQNEKREEMGLQHEPVPPGFLQEAEAMQCMQCLLFLQKLEPGTAGKMQCCCFALAVGFAVALLSPAHTTGECSVLPVWLPIRTAQTTGIESKVRLHLLAEATHQQNAIDTKAGLQRAFSPALCNANYVIGSYITCPAFFGIPQHRGGHHSMAGPQPSPASGGVLLIASWGKGSLKRQTKGNDQKICSLS